MNTATRALPLQPPKAPGRRSAFDWLYALLVIGGAAYAFHRYGASMDVYEKGILTGSVPVLIALGWFWGPLRVLLLGSGAAALLAIHLYNQHLDGFGADLAQADHVFLLKYFLSSQSAILWMSLLFFMSTAFYWIGLFARGEAATAQRLGSKLAWAAVFMALTGTMVRWFESHQIAPDVGHIPVSNLYEVFVLFCWVTSLFYLYYEQHYLRQGGAAAAQGDVRSVGAFVMLVVSGALGFLLWYTVAREAQEIQPLVFRQNPIEAISAYWAVYFGIAALVTGGILAARRRIAARLPALEVLDDLMYKSIAVGFAFFTIATILGAFWAAEAWGGYWSWDPKETWALIVWLNYAAWLHMRLIKGLRGTVAAWWALAGLAVTSFAFLGVNMFLSGLHSYGTL